MRIRLKGMSTLDIDGREIDRTEERTMSYFGPLAQVRMPHWFKGRICLVGDAGYCPSPLTGQGTSLALVGAFVLGQKSPADYASAFRRYEERMRPFVLANQDMVSVERRAHIPDDVFDHAKNAIDIEDLLSLSGGRIPMREFVMKQNIRGGEAGPLPMGAARC